MGQEKADERMFCVSHKGKRLCAACFNALPEQERGGRTVPVLNLDVNTVTGCSQCGRDCYYLTVGNFEKFGYLD